MVEENKQHEEHMKSKDKFELKDSHIEASLTLSKEQNGIHAETKESTISQDEIEGEDSRVTTTASEQQNGFHAETKDRTISQDGIEGEDSHVTTTASKPQNGFHAETKDRTISQDGIEGEDSHVTTTASKPQNGFHAETKEDLINFQDENGKENSHVETTTSGKYNVYQADINKDYGEHNTIFQDESRRAEYSSLETVTTSHKGYAFETKYPAVRSDQCPLCKCLIRQVVELPCDHGFCQECLQDLEEKENTEQMKCILCETFYREEQKKSSSRFDSKIKHELEILCKQKCLGCKWSGCIADYWTHLKKGCQYVEIECQFPGCSQTFERREQKKHQLACGYRNTQCQYCNQIIKVMIIKHHYGNQCQKFPTRCLNQGCQQVLPKDEIEDHLQRACLQQEIACKYSFIGCDVKIKRCNLDNHEKESDTIHTQLLYKKIVHDNITTRTELTQTRDQLSTAKKEAEKNNALLLETRDELQETKMNLKKTWDELAETQNQHSRTMKEAEESKTLLSKTANDLEQTKMQVKEELLNTRNDLDQTKNQLLITMKETADNKALLLETVNELQESKMHLKEHLVATRNELKQTLIQLVVTKKEAQDNKALLLETRNELHEAKIDLKTTGEQLDRVKAEMESMKAEETLVNISVQQMNCDTKNKDGVAQLMAEIVQEQTQQQQQQQQQLPISPVTPAVYKRKLKQVFKSLNVGEIHHINQRECFFKLFIDKDHQKLHINHREDISSFRNEEETIFSNEVIILNEVSPWCYALMLAIKGYDQENSQCFLVDAAQGGRNRLMEYGIAGNEDIEWERYKSGGGNSNELIFYFKRK